MIVAPNLEQPGRAELSASIAALFPPAVVATELRGRADPSELYPAEAAACRHAAAKRVAEFAAGRSCARRALHELGIDGFPLLVNPDRSARWPLGTVGSITHTRTFCGAVAGERSRFAGIGVDAEEVGRITSAMWRYLFTPPETAQLASLDGRERDRCAAIMFSAKEAFYKCQRPCTGTWLDFLDVAIDLSPTDPDGGRFMIYPRGAACRALFNVALPSGAYRLEDGRVLTGIAFERDAPCR